MRALVLLGLFGCDAVYGLNGRHDPDAAIADANVDDMTDAARVTCPASGPPTFTTDPVNVLTACKNYTTSMQANRALVDCTGIYESTIGTSSMNAAIINIQPQQVLGEPRLSPEGDAMFVVNRDESNARSIRVYVRAGSEWSYASTTNLPSASNAGPPLFVSPPTSKLADRHIMVHHDIGNTPLFSEWIEQNGSWVNLHSYSAEDLNITSFAYPSLTPDGLHLVFTANPFPGAPAEIRYASRESLSEQFDTPVKINVNADNPLYPHLAADCSRLYFTSINTVQYVE